jgi:hypothetical protein
MQTYREMKKRSPSTRLGDAMKAAKKTWNKGGASPATRKNRKGSRKNRSTRKN